MIHSGSGGAGGVLRIGGSSGSGGGKGKKTDDPELVKIELQYAAKTLAKKWIGKITQVGIEVAESLAQAAAYDVGELLQAVRLGSIRLYKGWKQIINRSKAL